MESESRDQDPVGRKKIACVDNCLNCHMSQERGDLPHLHTHFKRKSGKIRRWNFISGSAVDVEIRGRKSTCESEMEKSEDI